MTTSNVVSTRFLSLRWRLLIVFTLLFIAILSGLFFWFRNFAIDNAVTNLKNDLKSTAKAAAAGINGDEHTQLWQTGSLDDPTYLKINAYLREVKYTNAKASGIYTYIDDPDPNKVLFVVSGALPPNVPIGEQEKNLESRQIQGCQIPPSARPTLKKPYDVTASPRMKDGLIQPITDDAVTTDAQWGDALSGYAPIYNSRNETVGAVGVDMCAAEVQAVKQRIEQTLIPIFAILTAVCGLGVYLLAYRLTRPIVRLTDVANKIGHGEYNTEMPAGDGKVRDEVDTLSDVFALMVEKVRERENNLKQQVAELQIIVDETKRQQQVNEIVDSEFFQTLQEKAREARSRRSQSRNNPTPEGT